MKKLILAALAAIGMTALANPPGFTGDYNEALSRASAENKAVLAVFTGSDWCPYCIQMEKEYLAKPEFTQAVENDLVLLYVDVPRNKSKLDIKAATLNPQLVERYNVPGFPSLLFIAGDGSLLGHANRYQMTPARWGQYLVDEAKRLMAMAAGEITPEEAAVASAAQVKAIIEGDCKFTVGEGDEATEYDISDYDSAKSFIDAYADNVQRDADFSVHEAKALQTIRTQNRFWTLYFPPVLDFRLSRKLYYSIFLRQYQGIQA